MKLGLHSFSFRRKFYDVSFIFKILNNNIQGPEILENIGLSILTFYMR